jgi:hypothetical protein
MPDYISIFQSMSQFAVTGLGQVVITSITSTGLVSFYLKRRSDQQFEKFKKRLEIEHFKEILGRERADQQQAEALKEIWAALVNLRESIVDAVFAMKRSTELHLDEDYVGGDNAALEELHSTIISTSNTSLHAIERCHNELMKFSISIDSDLTHLIHNTRRKIGEKFGCLTQAIQALAKQSHAHQGPDSLADWPKGFNDLCKEFDFAEIDVWLEEVRVQMRKRLKVLAASEFERKTDSR